VIYSYLGWFGDNSGRTAINIMVEYG
jgi:hypothetical protein